MISVDLKSNQPLYLQIVEQYKMLLIKGYLKKNDPILSVRKLALELSITPGTVAKAYSILESQNIIETVRGKGTFIAGMPETTRDEGVIERVKEDLKKQCMELIYLGLDKEEVLDIVSEVYDTIVKGEKDNG